MRRLSALLLLACLGVAFHCATAPKVVDLNASRTKPQAEREQIYKENEIIVGGIFTTYKVGQLEMGPENLSPLFEAPYAGQAAKDKFSSGQTLGLFATIFAAGGGFMAGYNIGTSIRGGQEIPGLYIGAGVSVVTAFVLGFMAESRFADASRLYNDDLLKALDLKQKTAAIKPQEHFAHYAFSYAYAF